MAVASGSKRLDSPWTIATTTTTSTSADETSNHWQTDAVSSTDCSQTVYSPHSTLNLRLPSLFSRRCTDLDHSLPQHITTATSLLSSALAWRHISSNIVTRNYCCRACEVTLSFMDMFIIIIYLLKKTTYMLIALTYLLTYLIHNSRRERPIDRGQRRWIPQTANAAPLL